MLGSLDTRFDLRTQLLEVKDLRQGFGHLLERLKANGPLLIINRSQPAAVMVEFAQFSALVERLRELEDHVEEAELAARFGERLRAPNSETVSGEEFLQRLRGPADGETP